MAESKSTKSSFWELLSGFEIEIPQLQRDYAQGRDNDSVKQIRDVFVNGFYDALNGGAPMLVNFIYGQTQEGVFKPIDGQQRLTTLFLLHFYIFSRAEYNEGLKQLERFSYKTRDTSDRFSKAILTTKLDFAKDSIRKQLENQSWFTGNFKNDPTVDSMLRMLDTIHQRFGMVNDFSEMKDLLVSSDCPISFLWLKMEEFQRVDDLYIKMNARGKLLSDFEIFKAKLQETTILKRLLGENCSLQDQIDYISKYNNEFTEYFYKYFKGDSTDAESIDESIKDFDSAMMDFVKSIVRDDYFVYLKESEIGQKQYRDDYRLIPNMNGNVFSRFVEKGKFEREGAEVIYSKLSNPEDAITQSLVKVYALLNAFCNRANLSVDTVFTKKYYDETALFISMAGKDNLPENVIRYGLFSLLYKLGYPNGIDETKAYDCWKRFIYNLVNNSDVRNSEYAVEAMWILKCHIDAISKYDEKEILKVISECHETCASLRDQLKEERIKATLMQSGTDWYDLLFDAEEYFVDGQVGFLLDYSEMADGTYDIDQFKKYYAVTKSFFDCNKKINSNLDWKLFETALLCVDDLSGNNSAHLEKMKNSSTTWGFFEGKYAEYLKNSNEGQHNQKRKMLQLLWDKMGTGTIDDELSCSVTKFDNTPLTY